MQSSNSNFATHLERLIMLAVFAGLALLAYTVLGLYGFIALILTSLLSTLLVYLRWRHLRQIGLIAFLGKPLRAILLERSILDIFRDIVYFPYVIKIFQAIFTIATTRPHPDRIPQILKVLPPQVWQISTKKGILSLAPSAVQSLVLPQANKDLPIQYGRNDSEWDRKDEYHQGQQLVHEQTIEKRMVEFLDGKLGWVSVLVLLGGVLAGAQQMKHTNFKKMIVHNGTFCCLVLSMTALVIKIRRHYHNKKKKITSVIEQAQEIAQE